MHPINVQDLIFQRVPPAYGKNFMCNYCTSVGFTGNWWQTKIRFAKNAEFTIVVCSQRCIDDFKADPKTPQFIKESLQEMRSVNKLKKMGRI